MRCEPACQDGVKTSWQLQAKAAGVGSKAVGGVLSKQRHLAEGGFMHGQRKCRDQDRQRCFDAKHT